MTPRPTSRTWRRLVRDDRGFTLIELLVVMVMMIIVMTAVFGLLVSVSKVGYGDADRNASLDDQTVAFRKMINEVRQAYQVNCPSGGCTSGASSNYIDFDERIVESPSGGGTAVQQDRRVSYVCSVAQPGATSQYECVRYEAPASDASDSVPLSSSSCSQCLSSAGGSAGKVWIQRVVNTNVFSSLTTGTSASGAVRWISGKATIYTPGAGTLSNNSSSSNVSPYTHDLVLQQSFFMQQLDFGQ